MKTLIPIRVAGLVLASRLALLAYAEEADTPIAEQPATQALSTAESPAPQRKQYIDPFSGMPLPDYSYTNSLPVPARYQTLTVDPFSGTPLPPLVAPAPPKPKMAEEENEPEIITPIKVELPPGAYVVRSSARRNVRAIHNAPRLWEIASSVAEHWDFPPGAALRRK